MSATGFEILESASLTDVGVRRSHNQDAYAVRMATEESAWRDRGHVFLVADGIGGHAVGELASKLAADLIPHTYQKYASQGARPAILRAFQEANAHIHERGLHNPEFKDMGTTCTALLVRPDGAWIGHVGDSRAYRIRAGVIEQLSYDHSVQWELARRQHIAPEQVQGVPSNVILRSLGPDAEVEVDIDGPYAILPGDSYLLCSDGLSNQVSDEEMGAIATALPAKEACRFLVDLANLRGGPDNITVVLVRLPGEWPGKGPELPAAPPRPRRQWHRFIPWSGIALGAGIALAMAALLLLLILEETQLSIATFLLAVAALGAGLLGLLRQYREEPAEKQEEVVRPPPVHRRTGCQIDARLLQKLAAAEGLIQETAREKGWSVDWQAYQRHADASKAATQEGNFASAYREHCRATAVLAAALRQHRNKEEVFSPLWDRPDQIL